MANFFPEDGTVKALDRLFSGPAYSVRLFKNNHVPNAADLVGDYDEATFTGYLAAPAVWSPAGVNGDGKGEIEATQVTFTFGGGGSETIYGVFVLDNGGALIYADRFNAPVLLQTNGDNILYTPKVTCVTE